MIETVTLLGERGIELRSLKEDIDSTTPTGKLIFHIIGVMAEFERNLIRERTNAGLAAARVRGRVGGRPRKLKTNGKVALARRMVADQSHSIPEICEDLGISRATLYRYIKEVKPIFPIAAGYKNTDLIVNDEKPLVFSFAARERSLVSFLRPIVQLVKIRRIFQCYHAISFSQGKTRLSS